MLKLFATKQGLMDLFHMLDGDNDKHITVSELRAGLHYYGFNEEDINKISRIFNKNRNGVITLDKYKKILELSNEKPMTSQTQSPPTMSKELMWTLFDRLDVNKDGKVSRSELKEGMKSLGADGKVVESLMNYLDMDEDGFISMREFRVALCLNSEKTIDWQQLFDALDSDHSGDITVSELKRVFDRIGIPMLNSGIMRWISEYDRNKDGKLNYQEFLAFVSKNNKRAK
ncbi:uncharacterized protein DEA37_0004572 [Paragonimus westermani]|uniref:EF-hand domain-containing protein n=1 Tax=Paragonimus westermani TaxID=34504 RepID=A0A5J4NV95_9TREM|nr:uncharacterized protein DEA37_0004572 [Paragonimus westermani]